jgi:hypothetical protein
LATHHNKAPEESAEFSLGPLHALGCDPGTETVPDDQYIFGFRTLTNQPPDGGECVVYGTALGRVSGALGKSSIIDCKDIDLHT